MSDQELHSECRSDVSLHFSESSHVMLIVATSCGVLTGVLVSFLLYVFCLKSLILTKQGNDARRLLEPDDADLDQSDHNRRETTSGGKNDQEKPTPVNSDVAAFASRAKVVYPINQKYRPLADGASNPSLHKHSKFPEMANEDTFSSSDSESLSHEQDHDGSSQFLSSSLVPKSLQDQTFIRVPHYPHTVTLTGFEGRISLHCLALQDVQVLCCQIQDETFQLFLQAIQTTLSSHFPKDKKDAEFSKTLLQMQQKKVDELRQQMPKSLCENGGADTSCTLEEVERSQKYFLESGVEMSNSFSKHLEDLNQHLLKKTSTMRADEAEEATISLTETLLSGENNLLKMLETDIMRIHERLLWWEELTSLLQSQPALLIQEVTLRQSLMTTTLEKLTSEDGLTFSIMENILQEVQSTLAAGLQQSFEDYTKKTNELVTEKYRKLDAKKKKLQRSLAKDRSRVLESRRIQDDLPQLTKVHQDLLVKHRQQLSDLNLQQDNRMAVTLCNLWTKLRSTWSKRLKEQAKDIFCSKVSAHSRSTERLWSDLEQEFAAQLEDAEDAVKLQLEELRVQLDKGQQEWREEMVLVKVCMRHLSEQQIKILQSMVIRQSFTINRKVGMLIETKHRLLLAAVQRHFVARHFSLHMLKEMRLSQLKMLSQADFRVLLREDQHRLESTFKSSRASLTDLVAESHLVDQNLHQEFLSELETATEHLQSHAQLVLGNALSRAIEHVMQNPPTEMKTNPKQDIDFKNRLTEAVAESVYVTKDSLTAAVQSYYSRLKEILRKEETINPDLNKGPESVLNNLNKVLLRELANWKRKPSSAEFQQRVEACKRKLLEQHDVEEKKVFGELGRRKVAKEENLEQLTDTLLGEEEDFLREVASLARVSFQQPEPRTERNNTGTVNPSILELLAMNPDLDPALNPSLTPTVVAPVNKPTKKKRKKKRLK